MKNLTENQASKIANKLFETSSLKTVHITEDGQKFALISDARSHAKRDIKIFTFSTEAPETNDDAIEALEIAQEEIKTLKTELETEKATNVDLTEKATTLADLVKNDLEKKTAEIETLKTALTEAEETILAKDIEIEELKKPAKSQEPEAKKSK